MKAADYKDLNLHEKKKTYAQFMDLEQWALSGTVLAVEYDV